MGVRADPGGPRHGPGPARGPPPSLQPYSSPHTQQSPSTLPRPSASEPRPPTPREHRLTALLRETLATANCRTTMIAHVSDAPAHHAETLSTVQLAARVHRLRRKKVKVGSASWAPACVVVLVPRRRGGPRPRSPPGEPEQLTLGTVAAWSLSPSPGEACGQSCGLYPPRPGPAGHTLGPSLGLEDAVGVPWGLDPGSEP